MTFNDLGRRNSRYFAFFSSTAFLANYVTVVEDRPIMSVNIVSHGPVFHAVLAITNPPCSAVSL